jgi:hypothetical protein
MIGRNKVCVMSKHHLGFLPSRGAEADAVLERGRGPDLGEDVAQATMDGPTLAAADRAQLERDIAAIERATAALRRGDPALESWTDGPLPPAPIRKPRPVWLLIGVLWLSTALVTLGAVFALSALVG